MSGTKTNLLHCLSKFNHCKFTWITNVNWSSILPTHQSNEPVNLYNVAKQSMTDHRQPMASLKYNIRVINLFLRIPYQRHNRNCESVFQEPEQSEVHHCKDLDHIRKTSTFIVFTGKNFTLFASWGTGLTEVLEL